MHRINEKNQKQIMHMLNLTDHQNYTQNKNVNPCSGQSTAHGPCLSNISWIQANWFKQYHAHKKNEKPTWPWPLTWTFNGLLEVVKIHVHAKLQRSKCSGSWVIVLTERTRAQLSLGLADRTHGAHSQPASITVWVLYFKHVVACARNVNVVTCLFT